MAEVERAWFQRVLLGRPDTPYLYDGAVEDGDLVPLDDADWDVDLRAWQAECESTRGRPARRPGRVAGPRPAVPRSSSRRGGEPMTGG